MMSPSLQDITLACDAGIRQRNIRVQTIGTGASAGSVIGGLDNSQSLLDDFDSDSSPEPEPGFQSTAAAYARQAMNLKSKRLVRV